MTELIAGIVGVLGALIGAVVGARVAGAEQRRTESVKYKIQLLQELLGTISEYEMMLAEYELDVNTENLKDFIIKGERLENKALSIFRNCNILGYFGENEYVRHNRGKVIRTAIHNLYMLYIFYLISTIGKKSIDEVVKVLIIDSIGNEKEMSWKDGFKFIPEITHSSVRMAYDVLRDRLIEIETGKIPKYEAKNTGPLISIVSIRSNANEEGQQPKSSSE